MAVSAARRRAHVVLPDDLLREIDGRVGPRRRSEFIQEAIEEKLTQLRRVEAFERVVGSVADGQVPEWDTRESATAWVRKLRQEWEPENCDVATDP
jgi:Arc/MetJ-type ribon-helix-helix transcriptional regulator